MPGVEDLPAPEQIVCSAAVRTRQTADLVVQGMGIPVPLEAYKSLYEAQPDLVLQYLREVDEHVKSVLVVGHNPAMYRLAWELTGAGGGAEPGTGTGGDDDPTGAHAVLEAHGFPTCALAALTLEVGGWEDVAHGCGRLAGLFKPPY